MIRGSLIVVLLMLLLQFVHSFSTFGVAEKKREPNRIGSRCTQDDLFVYQTATGPLPNGIPTYTVHIANECIQDGCSIKKIHIACAWYSSTRLVNPRVFRRLSYNDCLVNDGRKLQNGAVLAFQYANSFKYPMSVSTASLRLSMSLIAPIASIEVVWAWL